MEVLLALLPIVSALITFLLNEIIKAQSAAADPKTQNTARYEQIDKDILQALRDPKKSMDATAHANADLAELERLRRNQTGANPR